MTRTFRSLLLLACLAFLPATQAQTKIAVIDLKKVFDGYWRTKQADAQLKERAADFEKVNAGLVEDFKKAQEELRKGNEAINDPALSAEERDRRKKDLEKLFAEARDKQTSIQSFDQNSRQELGKQQARMRDSVIKDIKSVLDDKAKAGGYALVFDLAATTVNQTQVIMYTSLAGTESDLTEPVLKQLNANAPPEGKKAADKAPEDPAKPAAPADKK